MDVIFNLERNTCRPHKKANDNINISSNHPPQIIKHFAQTISKNSFRNSSRAKIFQQSKPDYEEALKKRGYKAKLQHMQPNLEQNNARRTRKSIWFNLSFSLNVKTNVAKIFVELIDMYNIKREVTHKMIRPESISKMLHILGILKDHIATSQLDTKKNIMTGEYMILKNTKKNKNYVETG